jgi:hypothetical protein
MPSARRPLTLSVLAAALLCAGAFAQQEKPGKFSGLPETGQLDDQKVLQSRYGKSAPAPAATVAEPNFGDGITGVVIEADAGVTAVLPVSFGQVFAPGDLKPGEGLDGKLADGSTVPLQVDVKATHADGSVRHAVVSAAVPGAGGGKPLVLALVKDTKARHAVARAAARPVPSASALLDTGFTASASATIDGQVYSASADQLLRQKPELWLDGPLVTEWLVSAPLRNAQGLAHPRLSARFAVRWYRTLGKARVDVTLENTWAYEPAPTNLTYDARVLVGGKEVYAKPGLVHLNQARWRKLFWWGEVPAIHIRHDSAYLIASRALPNYDRSVRISGKALADLASRWSGPKTEPMGAGLAVPYMPTTGGRGDIGLLPSWAAIYLLSMDPRAKTATLGTADLAGSWSVHYRDQRTNRPVSLRDYPYMTIVAPPSDTRNPKTGRLEAFPACATDACKTPNINDVSHQPALVYLPYLVTGDFYYLEELEFWAMYDAFASNPGYRENVKGLLKSDQVRGQAWGLRTLGEAAYIVPDTDPLKADFRRILAHNLDWYNATYTNNPGANKLGFLGHGAAMVYKNKTGIAPWQDDFFTAAVGHVAELGFPEAARLLAWKVGFPIQRMTAPGACWIEAAMYEMVVRDSETSPVYPTMAQAFKASRRPEIAALPCASSEMAQALKLRPGEMTGTSSSTTGFPSNMQPALAYAADAGGKGGRDAWALFMSRSVKPDYGTEPQFAIVPRKAAIPEQ